MYCCVDAHDPEANVSISKEAISVFSSLKYVRDGPLRSHHTHAPQGPQRLTFWNWQ